MVEKLLDKTSYSLVRTNPKLTCNVKIISNGKDIYLESFSANNRLASSTFKAFKVDENSTYDKDIYNFFKQGTFPIDLAYDVFKEFSDTSVLNSFANQYEMFYNAGTRAIASESYVEDLGILSPLWLDEQIPNYFVVFRLNDPVAINNVNATSENANEDLTQTPINFTKNVLENCTAIKTFDLRESAPLGKYIRNYRNQESFPISPLTTTWRRDEPFLWNGISYKNGGFGSGSEFIFDDLVTKDATIIQNEYFLTQGFQRNGIILANLLNLEFLFTDDSAETYTTNRYFGLYVNEVEEGLFDISGDGFYRGTEKTQLPKIKSVNEVSEELNTSFELTNPNGILVYIDPKRSSTITGFPTPQRVNEVESIFYVKDKLDNFHTIKKGGTWENNQLRLFDKKIDISLLTGFKQPDTFATAFVLNKKGNAISSFKVLGEIEDGAKITFYDGDNYVGEIAANIETTNGPGSSFAQFFNPTGTPQEIVKAMSNALNLGIKESIRFFNATYDNDTLYVRSRFSGNRFNRLKFIVNWLEFPNFNIKTLPITSINEPGAYFIGGNDVENSRLKVNNGDQDRFKKGNYIQTKGGFTEILDSVPYLEEPIYDTRNNIIGYTDINKYTIITLNDNQVNVTRNNQVALYSDYKPSFGRFSIFPVRDFDFDFYSIVNSNLGELEFEEEYYNTFEDGTEPLKYLGVSTNPNIREFYDNGGFVKLIGLIRETEVDNSSNKSIISEYQRLEENFIKEQSIASKVVPYINKWAYVEDGKNVRNLPYRLNLSEAFGRNNFAPSKWTIGQQSEGLSHEWYYLCEFPIYFSKDAIENSWSYVDTAPRDNIEFNQFTGTPFSAGTFQDINTNNFDKYFIIDKFETNGITIIDKQLRYGRFRGGDSDNYASTFLRGVRIIAKPKALGSQKSNYNAKKIAYVKNGSLNDYRFSVMLIPNNEEKPETQIKFVKNDKWKTIVMLIFITINNECITNKKQSIDRTSLYAIKSNFTTDDTCAPIKNTAGEFEFNNGIMQGAISFAQSQPSTEPNEVGLFRIKGTTDINGIPTLFTKNIQVRVDGNYTPIIFNVNGKEYRIEGIVRVLSDDELLAKTITEDGIPLIMPSPFPSIIELRNAEYFTEGGGFNEFALRISKIGFASIFNDVNQGAPNIKYETIDINGERIIDANSSIAQTFSIELRAQDDVLKSVYLGVLPDPNKPTAFNLTDVIGYELSLQKRPRLTPIGRHSGFYEPLSLPLFKFRDPYLEIDFSRNVTGSTGSSNIVDESYKQKVLELTRYANTQFFSKGLDFGIIKNFFYHKVNQEDPSSILELSTDSAFSSLYPLINEVGISFKDYYIFSSNWEVGYFTKSIDKTAIAPVIGTRSMLEKKSFFGSKYLKVPQEIKLETFEYSDFIKGAIQQPDLVPGTFMVVDNSNTIDFYMFIEKRLTEFLFQPIKNEFIKFVNPLYGFGDEQTLNDDVNTYIKNNILKLYKIANVEFFVRSLRLDIPNDYETAKLDDLSKINEGLLTSQAFSSNITNTNQFDLKLIYNKRAGFSESFGFSVTLIKK